MTKMLTALCLAASTATAAAQEAKVTPLVTKELAGRDGKESTMVMVEYAPGGSDAEHRYNAHASVYVLEGAVVMQVKGDKEVTLEPGQTFYESKCGDIVVICHRCHAPAGPLQPCDA